MACILEELENTLKKQLGNTKNSKEFKDGATKAKERVAELSTLLNEVWAMKKAMQGQFTNNVDMYSNNTKEILALMQKTVDNSFNTQTKSPINISSNSKGLAGALTNPTELSKRKGNISKDYPITHNGVEYISVEEAFQKNKVDETVTKPSKDKSSNYKLMVKLITNKLLAYPELVKGIDKEGGMDYLNKVVHQPTNKNSVWETGGQNWFMDALKEAYVDTKNKTELDNHGKEAKKPLEGNKQKIDLVETDSRLSTEDKMYQLITVYKDQDAPKIGGGLVEDVTRKSAYDEDAKAATMMKGVQDSTLKDMLPKVDGRTINSYEKAVNAWYKDMKRGIAIQNKLTEFTELIKTIEYSPELMEELGWSKESTKQETDIIVPTETFQKNVNRKIECKE